MTRPPPLTVDEYVGGVTAGDRTIVARAMTLMESASAAHAPIAAAVLERLLPLTGRAYRVGVTGVPGVGKSTFIERLGMDLIAAGKRVAVLAIDPSSSISGGSILGDKTRMNALAQDERAFIRPSPSGRTLGGVARRTRETMLVAEAAGFDVVLIETVGVGQSETVVSEMVDFFLVLALAGAGDELQAIKRGLLELADVVAVTKADGDNLARAKRSRDDYASALRYTRPRGPDWTPQAVLVSAVSGLGVTDLWQQVGSHRDTLAASGALEARRREQRRAWMWSHIEERLVASFRESPAIQSRLAEAEGAVIDGRLPAGHVADALLTAFGITHGS